jgi:hypothetical protein
MRSRILSAAILLAALSAVSAGAATDAALALVPSDATTVGMVRLHEVRSSALTGRLFAEHNKAMVDGEASRFMTEAGLKPAEDVDTALVSIAPGQGEPQVLVAFEGRFDPAKLAAAMVKRGSKSVDSGYGLYYLLPEGENDDEAGAVAFVSPRLVLAGQKAAVHTALIARASGGTSFRASSPLAREITAVDRGATTWLVVDVQASAKLKAEPNFPREGSGATVAAALKNVSYVNVWATDTGDAIRFSATARSGDEETRQLMEDAARGMLATWRLAIQEKQPDLVPVIRQFEVSRNSEGVTLSGRLPGEMVQKLTAQKRAER